MYRLSKALGSLSVRSTIQMCHRPPPSLSSSEVAAAAAAAARWVTTINWKSYGNRDQFGDHDHQIRIFSGQTDGSKKKTKERKKKKKKKVGKYGHQSMIEFQRKWDKLELKRLKNLSHQAKLNEILSRCDKHLTPTLVRGSDEYDMEYILDYDLRQELMQSKGWVRVQSVLSHSEFKHWCNADLFMEALASHDGLDQCDVIYNRKVVETVELNKNRQYWQKLKRKQLKIEQVKKSKDYIRKVRLEWYKDDYKKYINTELDESKKEIIRLASTNLPVDAETSLIIEYIDTELDELKKEIDRLSSTNLPVDAQTSLLIEMMTVRQNQLEGDRNMIESLTFIDSYVELYDQNDDEITAQNIEFERCLHEYMIYYDIHLTKKERKDLRRLNDSYVELYDQNDDEITAQNIEFERCLYEYMIYYDIHLTKKERKDLRRLNRFARIDEELEELPSELVNDDISSSDPKYALMRHQRVTKEYLDSLYDIDENEDYDDLYDSHLSLK
ncbi:hypothetical protein FRACYDRAFT_251464 [Fragilariopsis cylindrus CCMP1102]|uniref:Uncharacterized protein n=1 Tax=Fragilariopsis cylindrus CCMP1102 TaxID=635003 RepID=A0A1E7ENS4_9STRA|nr:hypothetical protein FRACYDRAFT_251464 [Fragilariopsis cylindrus CCMP1102]|eukprot:OEU07173.1 hypothetical protein FRACYDRAFT_251464 [Fragilariopsis cylindrus CCMP1102]